MENMREYWAREAEMMRDKSAVLGTKTSDKGGNGQTFAQNIVNSAYRIFSKKVNFGLNSVRNQNKLFDTNYWTADGASKLEMKEGKSASKALLSIIDNTVGKQTLDCAQFVQVAFLGAILLTDGEKEFDAQIGKKFTLSSFGSTGIKTEKLYYRGLITDSFGLDNRDADFSNKTQAELIASVNESMANLSSETQEQLMNKAPIGSRVTVTNFKIDEITRRDNKQDRDFAFAVRARGWERENMMKIGDDNYAAFGVGYGASFEKVRIGLVDEYFGKGRYSTEQAKVLLEHIGVSHIEYFKRK
jgi:Protein-glutamine gamma-glutamyltransferase